MIRLLTIALTVSVPLFASAAGSVKYPVKPQDRVQISLAKAQVTLIQSADPFVQITSSTECHEIQAETRDNELNLREVDLLKPHGDSGHCSVQVRVPSQGVQVHVLEGAISGQNLKSDLLLHVQKGKISLRDSTGTAVVHVQRGDVAVDNYQGRLKLDLLQAAAVIRNSQGDLDLATLGGDHLIEKSKGNMHVVQSQGSLKINQSQGALQLETVRSTLATQAFNGRIEGQTQEGVLNLGLAGEPDVNLKSQAGRITLNTPPNSGAFVNLVTQEGEISGPAGFTVAREGSVRILRGRMKGSVKGNLVVRSQEGSLILK